MVVQEGNIRKTVAARGLVNGRGPRSGRDLVFRCYPPELLFIPPKKKQKLTFWVSLFICFSFTYLVAKTLYSLLNGRDFVIDFVSPFSTARAFGVEAGVIVNGKVGYPVSNVPLM